MPQKTETREVIHALVEVYLKTETDAEKLVRALRRAARTEPCSKTSGRLNRIAQRVLEDAGRPRVKPYRRQAKRPKHDDEWAVRRVVDGITPYPVLSLADARRAFIAMRPKRTLFEMAERLHMDPRTVSRWAKSYREGNWK